MEENSKYELGKKEMGSKKENDESQDADVKIDPR